MPPLPAVPFRKVRQALKNLGYEYSHATGSHHPFARPSGSGLLSVPKPHGDAVPEGTLRNVIRLTGLAEEEFLELL
ncbi:type II toxin-antitoxin system HicA family toxin [Nocardiopsis sp. CNT312]|uniref:type II toxin-antitoxin system HicA family toxin n=1 Tax=Nocardiopsis sp. CNT312 TaxID=1137268 RepID=UPI0004910B2D|nr:type II toxin-antitoxin system HicA family toxin [Nocardiopsis sp. CNT312]